MTAATPTRVGASWAFITGTTAVYPLNGDTGTTTATQADSALITATEVTLEGFLITGKHATLSGALTIDSHDGATNYFTMAAIAAATFTQPLWVPIGARGKTVPSGFRALWNNVTWTCELYFRRER